MRIAASFHGEDNNALACVEFETEDYMTLWPETIKRYVGNAIEALLDEAEFSTDNQCWRSILITVER